MQNEANEIYPAPSLFLLSCQHKLKTPLALAVASCFFMTMAPAQAAPVIIDTAVTKNNTDTDAIHAADNATVIVTPGGSITTTANGSNAIISGNYSSITNNGNIVTEGTYTGSSLSNAHFSDGILAGTNSTVINNGHVGTSGASAYAIYAQAGSTIINNGTIATSGQNANGLMGENNVNITNNGSVTTTGNGSYGVRGKDNAILTNNGTINTQGGSTTDPFDSATNTANAMQGGTNASLYNNGTIHTTGNGASGMAGGDGSSLTNTGNITVEGAYIDNGGGSYTFADGMMGGANATLLNTGTVKTTHTSIYGMFGFTGSTLTNEGNVITEGQLSDGMMAENDSSLLNKGSVHVSGNGASGMYGKDNATLTNAGNITVAGNADITHPIDSLTHYAAGITLRGNDSAVINTGTIDKLGMNGSGIVIEGTNNTVSNTGFINTGANGVELTLGSAATAAPSSASITTWATRLGKQNVFAVNNANLTFDNTKLILRAPEEASGLNQTYQLQDMAQLENGGTLAGSVGSVSSVMPMLSVTLAGNNIADQSVSMSVDAKNSYGQQANVSAIRQAQNRFWLANRTIAHALGESVNASASGWNAFGQSYAIHAGASGDTPSTSHSVGLLLGATKKTSERFSYGFHAGIETTDMNAQEKGLASDSTSWMAGLQGRFNPSKNTYIRGQLTGMVSRNDVDFSMLDDSASDKRTEYGFFANVTGGIDLPVNSTNTLTPEIGLAWLWLKNPSLDANWQKEGNRYMNVHSDSTSYHALFATAALRWSGDWASQGIQVKPTVALGVRQTLTDGDMDADTTFLGSRFSSSITDDKTVGTVEAGLTFSQKNMSMAIKYNGNFGSDTHDNVIWGEFGYSF